MKNFPIAIFALTLGAFSIGMTEFVIMGLLPNVANDLHVSISVSGQLITGYALGVAVGGPILTLSTGKMSRKRLLILLMILFVTGNAVAAVSTSYGLLMAARILTSFAHGTFFGVGAIMAARLVPKERSASAISFMFTGLTVANVLGVPFGTFIGNQLRPRLLIDFFFLLHVAITCPSPTESYYYPYYTKKLADFVYKLKGPEGRSFFYFTTVISGSSICFTRS